MKPVELIRDMSVRVGALVCLCFLLGSTGWLSWLYRIMSLADAAQVDFYTSVAGYLAQALGLGLFMLAATRATRSSQRRIAAVALAGYVALLDPATMSNGLPAVLGFGWAMNVLCGIFQGYYLACLAGCVEQGRRGTVFGCGYAVSTFATWALSSVGAGVLAQGLPCLAVCALLAVICIVLAFAISAPLAQNDTRASRVRGEKGAASLLVVASVAVVVVSLVKNAGFAFPTADLSGVVDLELSRLFYGVGLAIAGIMADRDRRYALVFCAASLVMPFLMLALAGAGASGVVLWAVGYLLFGFFAVWRVLLFADLAADGWMALAAGGLALGRVGDVLGSALYLAYGASQVALVLITAALFAVAVCLLVVLYRKQYVSSAQSMPPERDLLGEFCATYGLSVREREVLPLLVAGKTYAEIAAGLFVTESTVKYHVRNIREKTGCATRLEVADLYATFHPDRSA